MQLKKISLSLNPYDYSSIRQKNKDDTQTFAGLILRGHTLDEYGCPRVPSTVNPSRQRVMQSAVNRLVRSIYSINGATELLLQSDNIASVREKVNNEIGRFRNLGEGEEQRHNNAVEKRKVEKHYTDQAAAIEKEKPKDEKEPLEIGSDLKNLTPEEIASYTAAFRHMAEKRRAIAQAFKIAPHINTFGFAGLLMSGPQIYIPWVLTTDGIGLKSPKRNDRLAALTLLELEVDATAREFKIATEETDRNGAFLLFNYDDAINSISSVIDALLQEKIGTNDPDVSIKNRAERLKENARELENILLAKRGKKVNEGTSIILPNFNSENN